MSMLALSLHTTSVRTLWAKERSSYWWDYIVKRTFSCHDWLENFRMSEAIFIFLCNELRSNIKKTDTVMRDAIAVERRVALTLWFLATNSDYRTIGHLFGDSKLTVCVVVKEVCATIVQLLHILKCPVEICLRQLLQNSRTSWVFHNVLEWLMGHTYQLYPQKSFQSIIIIVKDGIPYLCKEWLIMLAISRMFILGGQEEYMMRRFSSIQACIDKVKVENSFLTGRRQSPERRFHYWCWVTLVDENFSRQW